MKMKQPHWLANNGNGTANQLFESDFPSASLFSISPYSQQQMIRGLDSTNSTLFGSGLPEVVDAESELLELSRHMTTLFGSPLEQLSPRTSGMTTPDSAESENLSLRSTPPVFPSVLSEQQQLYSVPQRRDNSMAWPQRSATSSPSASLSTGVQEKTILCKFFAKGNCTRGEECTFAHGIGDIKAARAGSKSSGSSPNPLKKTKLCRNLFVDGICPYGDNCDFAHGVNDLKCTAESKELDMSQVVIPLPELRQVSKDTFKTKICKHFFKTGKCWLEGECHFAHGAGELRKKTAK